MIHQGGYLIIEQKDSASFSQLSGDLRICGGIISFSNLPTRYPVCYRRVESFDNHFCDSWIPCNINEFLEEYSNFIIMHQTQLAKLKLELQI